MKKISHIIVWLYLILFNLSLFAQLPGDENDNGDLEGDDIPPASIDDYLLIVILIGVVFMFYYYNKNKNQIIS